MIEWNDADWVSVKDRLPECDGPMFYWAKDGRYEWWNICWWEGRFVTTEGWSLEDAPSITHWAPFAAPEKPRFE